MKYLILAIVGLLVVLALVALYCRLTYLDDTVSAGEGYGFRVGMDKAQASSTAAKLFRESDVSIVDAIGERGTGPRRTIGFGSEDRALLLSRDRWKLYFGSPLDSLRLDFAGGRLVEIHRHRNRCEMP